MWWGRIFWPNKPHGREIYWANPRSQCTQPSLNHHYLFSFFQIVTLQSHFEGNEYLECIFEFLSGIFPKFTFDARRFDTAC